MTFSTKIADGNGTPVSGARVDLFAHETIIGGGTSSAKGRFEFSSQTDYTGSRLKVRVSMQGFETLESPISSEGETELLLGLRPIEPPPPPPTATLAGRITEPIEPPPPPLAKIAGKAASSQTRKGPFTILDGIAERVQATADISRKRVRHIYLFLIENQQIEFRCRRPLSISDGDQVRVVGALSKKIFKAYACHNLTTNQRAHGGIRGGLFSAIFIIPIGVFFAWKMPEGLTQFFVAPKPFALIFAIFVALFVLIFAIFVALSISELFFSVRNFRANRILSAAYRDSTKQ